MAPSDQSAVVEQVHCNVVRSRALREAAQLIRDRMAMVLVADVAVRSIIQHSLSEVSDELENRSTRVLNGEVVNHQ
jgi:hypothetical protein